ncbi:MAG: hypothetical protein C4B57_02205 [Deltaproteobacteria bacterium]|nr:MAG: hypothetical protein C4B57_02205 [Deltaproteobacteria bacterium]
MNPLYPALERLPFSGFQSSLIADRKGQCNLARDRNPAKGKPLLRQGTATPRRNEPFISRLEAVTFFRVSKLIRCPYQSQCNLARDRNPAKGKPLLRQGTDGNRSREGDISLNSLTEAPVVFLAFAVGETPAPERSEGERGGGKTPPCQKP